MGPHEGRPGWLDDVDARLVQPYQAVKAYRCPGCGRDIPIGMAHVVAVPREAPDLRRHWHKGCWHAHARRLEAAAARRAAGRRTGRDGGTPLEGGRS